MRESSLPAIAVEVFFTIGMIWLWKTGAAVAILTWLFSIQF
jgi:hypothetical protein